MVLHPIGVIHTSFKQPEGMPVQPPGAAGVTGVVEIFRQYQAGLKDLDGFSHIILIYAFHQSRGCDLEVIPFMDTEPHGVFATRAPRRPNPIGLSIVRLERVECCNLYVQNPDVLDGTPLLDIKPYVPGFDCPEDVRSGWLEQAQRTVLEQKSDDRFI